MKRSFLILTRLCLGIALSVGLASLGIAQEKKEDRLEGHVLMINKETSTITLRETISARGEQVRRSVLYNDKTKFTVRNKEGSLDDVKEGSRLICVGKLDSDGRLVASRVDVRD